MRANARAHASVAEPERLATVHFSERRRRLLRRPLCSHSHGAPPTAQAARTHSLPLYKYHAMSDDCAMSAWSSGARGGCATAGSRSRRPPPAAAQFVHVMYTFDTATLLKRRRAWQALAAAARPWSRGRCHGAAGRGVSIDSRRSQPPATATASIDSSLCAPNWQAHAVRSLPTLVGE